MRNVFNALVKIIGVWMVGRGIVNLISALISVIATAGIHRLMGKGHPVLLSGIYLIGAGLSFFFAWVLIFKTDWVADKVRVPKDENPCQPLDRSALFPMGIQLVAGYFLFTATPVLIFNVISRATSISNDGGNSAWGFVVSGLPWIMQICLAVVCIFKADAIAKFILDKANIHWTKMAALALLASGVLVILIRIVISAMVRNESLF